MTTDTKAVARFNCEAVGNSAVMEMFDPDGEYVLFTDHEQLVAELSREIGLSEMISDRLQSEITRLRSALAAKTAEVEGLAKDAERYRWLRNPDRDVSLVLDKVTGYIEYHEGTKTGGYSTYEYRSGEELDFAIDAAMEKSNEHQDQ